MSPPAFFGTALQCSFLNAVTRQRGRFGKRRWSVSFSLLQIFRGWADTYTINCPRQPVEEYLQAIDRHNCEQLSGPNLYLDIVRGSGVIAVAHDAWYSREVVKFPREDS